MDEKRKRFEAENFVKMGLDLYKRLDFEKAKRCFQKAHDLDTSNKVARKYLQELGGEIRKKPAKSKIKYKEKPPKSRAKMKKILPPKEILPPPPRKTRTKSRFRESRTKKKEKPPLKLDLSDELSVLLTTGIRFMGAQEFSKAEMAFSKATTDFPESCLGWLYLGDILVIQGRVDEGRVAHQKAVSLEPSFKDEMKWHTTVVGGGMKPREFDEIIDLTEMTRRYVTPNEDSKLLFKGHPLIEQSVGKEISSAKSKLETDLSNPDLWSSLGSNLMIVGKTGEAVEAFVHALEIEPARKKDRDQLLMCLGLTMDKVQESQISETYSYKSRKAMRMVKETERLARTDTSKYCEELTIPLRIRAKKKEQLEEDLKLAKKTSKRMTIFGSERDINVITALNNLHRYQESEELCRHVLKDFPESMSVSAHLADALKGQKKYDEALKQARRTLELSPKVTTDIEQATLNKAKAHAHLTIGFINYVLYQYADAAVAYREVTELEPDWSDAWAQLGTTLMELDEFQEAEVALRRAIEIDPMYDLSWLSLSVALQKLGREKESVEAFERADELSRKSGRY